MNDRQLALISEIGALSCAAGIECWLRGGWAMDFFLHRITREHDDIDLFAWAGDAARLTRMLREAGFRVQPGPPAEAQRDFIKDREGIQIALLDRDSSGGIVVAGGPAAGTPWPDDMLTGPAGQLNDIVFPIVNPRVQIEIKERFPEWRPDLPVQAKHLRDIERLRKALLVDGCAGT